MTFVQLKYALALRRFGSFKRASQKLSITQPGLTLQIKKLEEHLGIILFDRSSSPVTPTPEGEMFLARAEDTIAGFEDLQNFSSQLNSGYSGKLTIGVIPTLAPFLVPLFVDDLQRDFPDFFLDIHEMTTQEVLTSVRNGEVDAGLISTPLDLFGIRVIPLFYERFFFYASQEHLAQPYLRLKSIDYKKLWLLNEGNCFRDQVNNFCDLKKIRSNKDFVYRSNSIDALIRIVDAKGGMTIMPELTTLSLTENQAENMTPIENKAREISLTVRSVSNKQRFIDKLGEYIKMNVPSHMLSAKNLEVVDPEIGK